MIRYRRFSGFFVASILCLATAGCAGFYNLDNLAGSRKVDIIDPYQQLSRADYRELMMHRQKQRREEARKRAYAAQAAGGQLPGALPGLSPQGAPPIPAASDILVAPTIPSVLDEKTVSIAVSDHIPLKDVLVEISRMADLDLELDPGIEGGIIFRAKNRPLSEVMERISHMAGLRYEIKGNVIRIERDLPYVDNYKIDILNLQRDSQSSVTVNTNVLSAGDGDASSFNTGSNSTISSDSESDLWSSLKTGLDRILAEQPVRLTSHISTSQEDESGNTGGSIPPPPPEQSGGSGGDGSTGDPNKYYVINKHAGVITVSATKQQHEKISRFLEKLHQHASAQVLIEAKIVEVTLDEEYRTGIDWNVLLEDKFNFRSNFGATGTLSNAFNLTLDKTIIGDNLDSAIEMLQIFGTSRTLSSPRLSAVNNQQAVLTFAENKVFFNIDVEREEQESDTGNDRETVTVDSEVKTVPIGIILTMQPSIDVETGEVTLSVRPTLSRVTGTVSDPAVAYLASIANVEISNDVPEVEVRELDSILRVSDGDIMIIGGLIEQRSSNTDTGVPVFGALPVLGNFFKSVSKTNEVVELVIFIKATIVPPNGRRGIHSYDKHLYRKYMSDPRPLAF